MAEGNDWNQIFYINFEDDRLLGFNIKDFDDLIETAHELTDRKIYYFFDEIQNIDGWEKFARRLADYHERVYITGSNSSMLSSEMESRLGGRYISVFIMPFSFTEILNYRKIPYKAEALYSTNNIGRIRGSCEEYIQAGGLPESLRMMVKKTAETVMHETSFNRLAGSVRETGLRFSADAAIKYIGYCEEAYLLFHTNNFIAKFSERESTPRYYFMDNGFLSLFLVDKKSAMLENTAAVYLYRSFKEGLYYFKSRETMIDIDFFIPARQTAIQVCYDLNEESCKREIDNLIRFSRKMANVKRLIIVTKEENRKIEKNGINIEVIPLYQFLLEAL